MASRQHCFFLERKKTKRQQRTTFYYYEVPGILFSAQRIHGIFCCVRRKRYFAPNIVCLPVINAASNTPSTVARPRRASKLKTCSYLYHHRPLLKVPFWRNVPRTLDSRGRRDGGGSHGLGQLLQLPSPKDACLQGQ